MLKFRVLSVRKHTRIQSPMNQPLFGCQTEKLDDIAGQLSFFNEVEANYNGTIVVQLSRQKFKHFIMNRYM